MINKIANVRDRKIVYNYQTLEEVVKYVSTTEGRPEINYIIEARKLGKGSDEYRNIKQNNIPAVVLNFNHSDGYVKGSTVSTSTGYMYLDIDHEEDMSDLDPTHVAAYWKSISNHGYSLIVKVSGLVPDTESLREAYRHVGKELDIRYDPEAISVDRVCFLSYDPDAYFNPDAETLTLPDSKSTQHNRKETPSYNCDCNGVKFRSDNLEEVIAQSGINIVFEEDGIFDFGADSKLEYSCIYVPRKTTIGSRERRLSSIAHQYISLNKNMPKAKFKDYIFGINREYMFPPLKEDEVKQIVEQKYSQKERLTPLLNKKKRFYYNPELNLRKEEKLALNCKRLGKDKVEKSKTKIRNALQDWDFDKYEKITIANVAKITEMNRKTVQKYYKDITNELGISKNSPP